MSFGNLQQASKPRTAVSQCTQAELQNNSAVEQLQQLQQDKPIITFVYAAHDTEHNSALVLKTFLEEHPQRP